MGQTLNKMETDMIATRSRVMISTFVVLATGLSWAADGEWAGTASGNWNDGANWKERS
jgi:hypothetical protein